MTMKERALMKCLRTLILRTPALAPALATTRTAPAATARCSAAETPAAPRCPATILRCGRGSDCQPAQGSGTASSAEAAAALCSPAEARYSTTSSTATTAAAAASQDCDHKEASCSPDSSAAAGPGQARS